MTDIRWFDCPGNTSGDTDDDGKTHLWGQPISLRFAKEVHSNEDQDPVSRPAAARRACRVRACADADSRADARATNGNPCATHSDVRATNGNASSAHGNTRSAHGDSRAAHRHTIGERAMLDVPRQQRPGDERGD